MARNRAPRHAADPWDDAVKQPLLRLEVTRISIVVIGAVSTLWYIARSVEELF